MLKAANSLFKKALYTEAVKVYFNVVVTRPEIAGIIFGNIDLSKNRLLSASGGGCNVIVSRSTEVLEIKEDVEKRGFDPRFFDSEFFVSDFFKNKEKVLDFLAENPANRSYVFSTSPQLVFLGLLYYAFWGCDVRVLRDGQLNLNAASSLLDYLEVEASPQQLAMVASFIDNDLITVLRARSEGGRAIVEQFKSQDKLLPLFEYFDGDAWADCEKFVNFVFFKLLGREVQPHELNHFSSQLRDGHMSRFDVVHLIATGEECVRYFRDRPLPPRRKTFLLPKLGDINPEEISLPEVCSEPEVSILIPVYGKVEYTLACIKSIAETPTNYTYEVLVLDDRSPDNSVEFLRKVKNLRVVVNPENLGFLRSCNHGAKQAKGKYIYLLNNDTLVKPGYLDELRKTFDLFPGVGLVGSKLTYPDGTLQEAGGIIWQDGSAWNLGNKQDPNLPVFNYAREVDYVSGASVMIPAGLYSELGGFDERYVPAYCEDSDLALRIRHSGYRVIYQPLSEVVHFEGVTSGTDTKQGVKSYQVANSKKLFDRWEEVLRNHGPNGENWESEMDRRSSKRALVIEHCTPTPDQDAGSVSVFNILLLLREMDFQVTFIPEDNFLYMPEYTTKLQRAGVQVLYRPFVGSVTEHLEKYGDSYDLAFLFRPVVVERHLESIKKYCPKAKTLFYTHDIHHIRMMREAVLLNDQQKIAKANEMKDREFKAIRSMDMSILVSPAELEQLRPELADARLVVLPLLLNVPGTSSGFENRKDFCFVGGFQHQPNVDAVLYFAADIMPHVRRLAPGVKFHVIGAKPPAEVLALACEDIVVHGFVEDLAPLLDSYRLSVAPLRYGAGVKGKVGTSLAAGLPGVLSPIAAEGMELAHGVQAMIAKDDLEFAELIARVYADPELWQRLSENGVKFAHENWGGLASYTALNNILRDLDENFHVLPSYPLVMYNAEF